MGRHLEIPERGIHAVLSADDGDDDDEDEEEEEEKHTHDEEEDEETVWTAEARRQLPAISYAPGVSACGFGKQVPCRIRNRRRMSGSADRWTAVRLPRFAQGSRVPLDAAVPCRCLPTKEDTQRAFLGPCGVGGRHPLDYLVGSGRGPRRGESGLAETAGAVRVQASRILPALRGTGRTLHR